MRQRSSKLTVHERTMHMAMRAVYNGEEYDMGGLTPERFLEVALAPQHPDLAGARHEIRTLENGDQIVEYSKRSGTKG